MCGRARFAILANRQIRRYTSSATRGRGRGDRRGQNNPNQSSLRTQQEALLEVDQPVDEISLHEDLISELKSDDKEGMKVIENISPGFVVPTVRFDGEKYIEEEMVWGLIPIFNMNEKPDHYRLFNKRVESFSNDHQYFNRLLQAKRCVVVFDGFYEWKVIAGKKQPYYVYLKDQPIQMAAIYEEFKHDFSNPYFSNVSKSFSIITGTPCQKFQDIHNRQPIFLTDEQASQWLNPETAVFPLLQSLERNSQDLSLQLNSLISYHPVSHRVTDPKYQSEDCTRQISLGLSMNSFLIRPSLSSVPINDDHKSSMDLPLQENAVGEKRKLETIDLRDSPSDFVHSPPVKVTKTLSPIPAKSKTISKTSPRPIQPKGIAKYFLQQK